MIQNIDTYDTIKSLKIDHITTNIQPFTVADDIVIIYVRSGELQLRLPERECTLASGDMCILLPTEVYSYRTKSISSIDILHISCNYASDFVSKHCSLSKEDIIMKISDSDRLIGALTSADSDYLISSIIYYIAHLYECDSTFTQRNDKVYFFATRTLEYISEYYDKEPTIDDLASTLGYATHYTSSLIGKVFGTSFMGLINDRRIERARLLLKDETLTITDVAIECGYGTQRSFNRNFTLIMGVTPTEYREQFFINSSNIF